MLARIQIPDTEPETELIDGRLVQKMSPKRRHQALEQRWVAALTAWSRGRGEALTEWRHQFTIPGGTFTSLVPDVAYMSHAVLDALGPSDAEAPPRAPEIVVEVLSRGESERNLVWKTRAYLDAGTLVVFVVDPPHRTVVAHARDRVTRFTTGETVVHAALPDFAYDVDTMFDGLYLGD
jgi:Uma2 family endonuclease